MKRNKPSWLAYLSTIAFGFALNASSLYAGEVRLAAAASLKDALEDLKPAIEKLHPGTTVVVTTGASGMLQQQIVNGAPIDVFISAAKKPMDGLGQSKLLTEGSRKILLKNELVLIAPEKSKLKAITDLKDKDIKRIGVGEPRSVPAGDYALQTLTHYELNTILAPKFVYAKDVRQVLSYVERGEVDAGFVYASDALTSKAGTIKVVTKAPNESHEPIVYEIAAVVQKDKTRDADIQKVMAYLEGQEAMKVWQKFGFLDAGVKTASKDTGRAPL